MEQERVALKLVGGDVVLIKGAERINLGRKDPVCEELCRFLEEVDFGECAGVQTQK